MIEFPPQSGPYEAEKANTSSYFKLLRSYNSQSHAIREIFVAITLFPLFLNSY